MYDGESNGNDRSPVTEVEPREIGALTDTPVSEDSAVLRAVSDLEGVRVEDASGITVGAVHGSLAEAETGLVRYLDLSLDDQDHHVLVPIGHARVSDDETGRPEVRLRAAMLEQLEEIPPFEADTAHIDDPFERELLEAYGRTFHGERYYAHPAYDHEGVYAGEHQVITITPDEEVPELDRLAYLSGWDVAEGEPDIRGWPLVLAGDDTKLDVVDLVVDTRERRVRYIVLPTPDDDGARLIPIGFTRIDPEAQVVTADGFTAKDIEELPVYSGGGVTREFEERVTAALRRLFSGPRKYLLPDYHGAAH